MFDVIDAHTLAEGPPAEIVLAAGGFSDAERRAMLRDNAAASFDHARVAAGNA
jgi:hypothetical protein